MAKTVVVKPLGLVLRKAGLVSSNQIEKALQESSYLPHCKIGEILAIRGWIKPQTADFFAEVWPRILASKKLQPIGQYLKAASLIDEKQIAKILQIQTQTKSKFGKIAVEQNIISQATLDFFLDHLKIIKTEDKIKAYTDTTALKIDRIEHCILHNQKCEPAKLLQRYRTLFQQDTVVAKGDLIEKELLNSGLVTLEGNALKIAKQKYARIFDRDWVERELARLQPYHQIRLKIFGLEGKADLPHKVIDAVNYWTEHQLFLTQKLYQLIQEQSNYITPGKEETIVEELIYENMIDNWKTCVAAKHFQEISDRVLHNKTCSPKTLLKCYKKILQLKKVNADNSPQQTELLRTGLIELVDHRVSVSNLIYQAVFDRQWVKDSLNFLENTSSDKANIVPKKEFSSTSQNSSLPKNIVSIIGIVAFIAVIPFIINLLKDASPANNITEEGHLFLEQ